MGRFQSTVSTIAALASIFAAGAAGWKLASESAQPLTEQKEELSVEAQDTTKTPQVAPEVTPQTKAPSLVETNVAPLEARPALPQLLSPPPPPPVDSQASSESGTGPSVKGESDAGG
jgi:hypothetical protein